MKRSALTLILTAVLLTPLAAQAQLTWTLQNSGTQGFLRSVAHGSGRFVAVGSEGVVVSTGVVISSVDGVSWQTENIGMQEALADVTFGGGQFVTVGRRGTILTSPDGLTWTPRTSGTTSFLTGVAHGGGAYVAVGVLGAALRSTDGISWTPVSVPSNPTFEDVIYEEGLFLAVGQRGTVATSADGTTWTTGGVGATISLDGAGFFNGKFYVVGQVGAIFSSPDAAAWTLENSGSEWKRAVSTDGQVLVAAGGNGIGGPNGEIISSTDGTNWMAETSGVTQTLYGMTFANGMFVVVGDPGTGNAVILTAPAAPNPDTDGDKLEDAWEIQHFGAIETRGGNDDPDFDGIPNIAEFLHDLNPTVSDVSSPRLPTLSTTGTAPGISLVMTWTWDSVRATDLNMEVRYASSLAPGAWLPLSEPIQLVSDDGNGIHTVRIVDPSFSSDPRRFYAIFCGE